MSIVQRTKRNLICIPYLTLSILILYIQECRRLLEIQKVLVANSLKFTLSHRSCTLVYRHLKEDIKFLNVIYNHQRQIGKKIKFFQTRMIDDFHVSSSIDLFS